MRRGQIIAAICVAVHVVACVLLMISGRGTELNPDVPARQQWIQQHAGLWAATWVAWMLSSTSLLAFCIAWAKRLGEVSPRRYLWLGCGLVTIGVACDLYGEAVNMLYLPRRSHSLDEFIRGQRIYALASVVTANGLYCIGGLVLSAAAWRGNWLRGFPAIFGFAMWSVGLLLSVAAMLDHQQLMIIAGGAVMTMFIPWAGWVGKRL